MAFTDIERARNLSALNWFLKRRRPPEHIRAQLDIGYVINGHTADIVEFRPDWRDTTVIRQTPVARVRFVRTRSRWCLYWMRQDLKWHLYEPGAFHASLKSALESIDNDEYSCFFG
jgi:hypothetical protein